MDIVTICIILAVAAFVVALIAGKILIPVLHKLKFGQEIREEGPKWHAAKSGTPTMGGMIFIFSMLLVYIICMIVGSIFDIDFGAAYEMIMLFSLALAFGVIGFIDDYIKVILKRNLGLTAIQKFSLQFIVSLLFSMWVALGTDTGTQIAIPFINRYVDLSWLYIPFTMFVMLASVNSVNLTDGLDGLASSVTIVVALFYTILSVKTENCTVAFFGAALIGSLVGFLCYNWKPAKVFMGDTGSLFLGGAVCGMAILLKQPITLLIVGFVYVMETLSVIIQVASYKLTGKRVFKMSPIHHHFEMCGWSEIKVVTVFTAVTVILCALMYLAL